MANTGGTYVLENGKKRLINRTRPAKGKNGKTPAAAPAPLAKPANPDTEEQAKA